MMFWLFALLMIALALLFVLLPVLRGKVGRRALDRRTQNLETYRHRLRELEAEKATGVLNEADFQSLKKEMEASLLDDLGEGRPESAAATRQPPVWLLGALLLAVPVVAVSLYQHWGAGPAVAQAEVLKSLAQVEPGNRKQVNRLLDDLEDTLTPGPGGWALLARQAMRLEAYERAARAYRQLARSVSGNPEEEARAWGLVAQARFFANRGRMTDAVTQAIDRARELNPDDVNTLGLLGIHAFQTGSYRDAVAYWEQLLAAAPDYPQASTIRQGVARARQLAGMPDAAPSGSEGPSVRVEVSLADSLKERPAPDATLFIYAKAVNGPPMPLAITRLSAGDLPTRVTLTDAMAMSPQARLSGAEEVMLVARVSTSGNAMPQPGDWQGTTGPIPVTEEMGLHQVTIDHRLAAGAP